MQKKSWFSFHFRVPSKFGGAKVTEKACNNEAILED
jgi:hypothetical protein